MSSFGRRPLVGARAGFLAIYVLVIEVRRLSILLLGSGGGCKSIVRHAGHDEVNQSSVPFTPATRSRKSRYSPDAITTATPAKVQWFGTSPNTMYPSAIIHTI